MFVPCLSRRGLQVAASAVRPVQSRYISATPTYWNGFVKLGGPSSQPTEIAAEVPRPNISPDARAAQAEQEEDDRILAEELGFSPDTFVHGEHRVYPGVLVSDDYSKILKGLSSESVISSRHTRVF